MMADQTLGKPDPAIGGSTKRRSGGPPLTEVAVEEWAPGAPARGRAPRRSSAPRARTGPQAPEPERTQARHRRRTGTTPKRIHKGQASPGREALDPGLPGADLDASVGERRQPPASSATPVGKKEGRGGGVRGRGKGGVQCARRRPHCGREGFHRRAPAAASWGGWGRRLGERGGAARVAPGTTRGQVRCGCSTL